MTRALEVLRPGPASTVQDRGRPGLAHLGVTRSGAADRGALALANRLLGNAPGAAGIEVTLGGLALRAHGDLLVAVTGAELPVTVDGRPAPRHAPVALPDGAELALGTATAGLRAYVAVRGGLDVPPVLGSRATDTLSGLGPAPLAAGHRLPVGADTAGWPLVDVAAVPPPAGPDVEVTLRAVAGPRADRLAAGALDRLAATSWRVSSAADRVGVRLEGAALALDGEGDRPSEGAARGSIQVPPGGEPVVFLADHPVTGGYPVAAVVLAADVDRAAQLRPGQPVRVALVPAPDL